MPSFSVSVPGKTILFGEHAVVYGFPAIAIPLDSVSLNMKVSARPINSDVVIINRIRGENLFLKDLSPEHTYKTALEVIQSSLSIDRLPALQLEISSSIPIASGLGSSAAFAVCLTRTISGFLGFKLINEQINDIAFKIETYQHGTPSGIDNTVIAYNKPVYFKKAFPPSFLRIKLPLTLVIADTGIRSTTKETVTEVSKNKKAYPSIFNILLKDIGLIAESAKKNLEDGNFVTLGKLMSENHSLLQKLGVSCDELDYLVEIAMNHGALGAKLCGSGKGGNIVAIVENIHAEYIKSALQKDGATSCFISIIETNSKEL
jgi:mevalonate kinase